MDNLKLYRRRYIPDEIVFLKDDIVVSANEERIVTKWKVLKKRADFSHGASCYFLKKGIKVSKFIDDNENLLYWYCDIINYEYNKEENTYTFNDLLIDVIIYPDGFVKVVDMEEIADALEQGLIDEEVVKSSLRKTNALLTDIYNGNFDKYTEFIKDI